MYRDSNSVQPVATRDNLLLHFYFLYYWSIYTILKTPWSAECIMCSVGYVWQYKEIPLTGREGP
jgi:hypothetical protein